MFLRKKKNWLKLSFKTIRNKLSCIKNINLYMKHCLSYFAYLFCCIHVSASRIKE